MPATKVQEQQVLEGLTEVFQVYGYAGASLSRLTEATGLQRASLYHRFPGGKEEMANVVLERAFAWVQQYALDPLAGSEAPAERVRSMTSRLEEFYHQGRRSCLLDTLSLGAPDGFFSEPIRGAMQSWIKAMAEVAEESGLGPDEALRRAEEAMVSIEGGLVVARATEDPDAFHRALASLPGRLTGE